MEFLLHTYLSSQLLLMMVFGVLLILKITPLSFRWQLKTSRYLLLLALIVPVSLEVFKALDTVELSSKINFSDALPYSYATKIHSLSQVISPETILSDPPLSSGTTLHAFIWATFITIIVVFMLIQILHYIRAFQSLRNAIHTSKLIRRIGSVRILASEYEKTPFSFRFMNSYVVLPKKQIKHWQSYKISVYHELQHHRQGDTFFSHVHHFIKIVFGINPMIGKLTNHMFNLEELSCDEYLLGQRGLSPDIYSTHLINVAKSLNPVRREINCASFLLGHKNHLKRRIEMMFNRKRSESITTKLAAFTISTAALFSGGLLCYSAGSLLAKAPEISTSVAADRFAVDTHFEFPVNEQVLHWLNRFTTEERYRRTLRKGLSRMEQYRPLIEAKLSDRNLPREFLAIPLVESNFNNEAVSPSPWKAAGLWQFIPKTARTYGLRVDASVDERKNVEKATEAALQFLTNMKNAFGQWTAAFQGYNVGQHKVLQEMMKHGHGDVLKLAKNGHFGEAGSYVPKLIAGMIIVKYPEMVGFERD